MPKMHYRIKSIVTRKLKSVNYVNYYFAASQRQRNGDFYGKI